MKLPDIVQQPVGEFALGDIPTPRVDKMGEAIGNLAAAGGALYASIQNEKLVGAVDEATGETAKELSELRAILVNENTVDADWVGDDALGEIQISTTRNGERETTTAIRMFTHEIAEEVWGKRSQEIIAHYAATIDNPKAREKFIGEMNERFVSPGTQAVLAANIIRSRSFGQAKAERAVEDILASNAPPDVKEENAKEIISRQILLGADPTWAETQISALGPNVDAMVYQNRFRDAQTQEEVEDIRDDMWAGDNRMTPAQLRTMDAQAVKALGVMAKEEADFQREQADDLWVGIDRAEITVPDVTAALEEDRITSIEHNKMINALTSGSDTDFSSDGHLSAFRNKIIQIPFTGNTTTVREQGRILKNRIMMASRGLTPLGQPDGLPATISGTDAAKLLDEIDREVEQALSSPDYDRAWLEIKSRLNVSGGPDGMVQGMVYGTQPAVDAAMAFKKALDNYMNSYGIDAKPGEFVTSNLSTFSSENFEDPLTQEFVAMYGPSKQYMTEAADGTLTWSVAQRNTFRRDTAAAYRAGTISQTQINAISARYAAYYLGTGTPPPDQAREIETNPAIYER